MLCAVYARYSSDLQNPRSAADQVAVCRKRADERGWYLLDSHVYLDEGISGASLLNRPGLLKLLAAAEARPKPFDCVMVEDTSRLSRAWGETQEIIQRLAFYGVDVHFVNDGFSASEKQSSLRVGVKNLLDSQYRQDLADKTMRGLKAQVARGYSVGAHVYGYRYESEEHASGEIDRKTGRPRVVGVRIEIDDDQAAVVREIFRLFVEGYSVRSIAAHLNSQGYESPGANLQRGHGKTKCTWLPNTVRAMLCNPRYIGDWTFNKTRWVVNPTTGQRRRVDRPKEDWVECRRPELAITDSENWEAAQRRIEAGKRGPQRNKGGRPGSFVWSGMLRCHECGGSYVVITGAERGKPRFGCNTNHQRGAAACSNNFRVTHDELDRVIFGEIERGLLSPAVLSAFVGEVNRILRAEVKTIRGKANRLHRERDRLWLELQNLLAFVRQGRSFDSVDQALRETEDRLAEVDAQLKAADSGLSFERLKVDQQWAATWIRQLRETARENPRVAREQLQTAMEPFVLTPEMRDGIRMIRVSGHAKADGFLRIACRKQSAITEILRPRY